MQLFTNIPFSLFISADTNNKGMARLQMTQQSNIYTRRRGRNWHKGQHWTQKEDRTMGVQFFLYIYLSNNSQEVLNVEEGAHFFAFKSFKNAFKHATQICPNQYILAYLFLSLSDIQTSDRLGYRWYHRASKIQTRWQSRRLHKKTRSYAGHGIQINTVGIYVILQMIDYQCMCKSNLTFSII